MNLFTSDVQKEKKYLQVTPKLKYLLLLLQKCDWDVKPGVESL